MSISIRAGLALLPIFVASGFAETNPYRVEIDLSMQTASLIRGRYVVMRSPISSGRYGHLTSPGEYKVIEKEIDHHSSIYGKIVDANGNTVVADADADMKVPRGGKFIAAPMHYFMRFHEADGMHAGILPGYAASHGCVRMPEQMAIAFYNAVQVGTPVTVFGRTPRANDANQNASRGWFGRSLAQPQYQPRVYQSQAVDPRWR